MTVSLRGSFLRAATAVLVVFVACAAAACGDKGPSLAERAAAAWVARLSSSDATEADRRAFEAWHAADPAHATAYAEMDALWEAAKASEK